MTAEKGEHERAPRAGESYLTPLRATLRDPPSKWAIKGLFPECRAAGFLLHTFLSPSKEKCESPMGRQVPLPRRRRRVKPGRKKGLRLRAHQRAFRSPFGNLRALKLARNPWKLHPLHSWQNGRTPPKARGCPRGKRSVRPALACAPLVGCLNSESFPPSVRAFHRVASSFLAIAGKVS